MLMNSDGSSRITIAPAADAPSRGIWDKHGCDLCWIGGNELYILDMATGSRGRLTGPPVTGPDGHLAPSESAWDSMGKSLFVDMLVSSDVGPDAGIWHLSIDGKSSPAMVLPPAPCEEARDAGLQVSPNGRYLVASVRGSQAVMSLWFYDIRDRHLVWPEPYSGEPAAAFGRSATTVGCPQQTRVLLASNPKSSLEQSHGPGCVISWDITTGPCQKTVRGS